MSITEEKLLSNSKSNSGATSLITSNESEDIHEPIISKLPAESPSVPALVSPNIEYDGIIDGNDPRIVGNIMDNYLEDIKFRDLKFLKEIGRGGFGVVTKGKWRKLDVAIKTMTTETHKNVFYSEIQIMKKISHPNIVRFYGSCLSNNREFCIIMEYLPGGNLYNLLHSQKDLPWDLRWSIAYDITSGLEALHQMDIIHRDLKDVNILMDEQHRRACLCDFGLSKEVPQTREQSTSKGAGTTAFMAPELFSEKPVYSKRSDVYSLGLVFWTLTTRETPFKNYLDFAIHYNVNKGAREVIPEFCFDWWKDLISDCWDGDKDKRPTVKEVLEALEKNKDVGMVSPQGYANHLATKRDLEGVKDDTMPTAAIDATDTDDQLQTNIVFGGNEWRRIVLSRVLMAVASVPFLGILMVVAIGVEVVTNGIFGGTRFWNPVTGSYTVFGEEFKAGVHLALQLYILLGYALLRVFIRQGDRYDDILHTVRNSNVLHFLVFGYTILYFLAFVPSLLDFLAQHSIYHVHHFSSSSDSLVDVNVETAVKCVIRLSLAVFLAFPLNYFRIREEAAIQIGPLPPLKDRFFYGLALVVFAMQMMAMKDPYWMRFCGAMVAMVAFDDRSMARLPPMPTNIACLWSLSPKQDPLYAIVTAADDSDVLSTEGNRRKEKVPAPVVVLIPFVVLYVVMLLLSFFLPCGN